VSCTYLGFRISLHALESIAQKFVVILGKRFGSRHFDDCCTTISIVVKFAQMGSMMIFQQSVMSKGHKKQDVKSAT